MSRHACCAFCRPLGALALLFLTFALLSASPRAARAATFTGKGGGRMP
jgi:hypothetical protein